MKSYLLIAIMLCVVTARPEVFKSQFLSLKLSDDRNGDGKITYDEVDPPAGHGLPEFSMPVEDMTAAQLEKEINDWKMSEASAEDEFYSQTEGAISQAMQDIKACEEIPNPEERKACIDEAQDTIDGINDMISDLQTEHAIEEEVFDAAMDEELEMKRAREAAALLVN
ncbi:hypothetical protein SteCoe_5092 [Stentor coeruleus]|uniref:EF-hand domain-containing protein n=1 Tax=Stentor coeruleus TaxID=5963 RepID=A0A1R2CT94_9CILI|nr:hypothetical protein SteCoe_5092 [Stentor coeruleus]